MGNESNEPSISSLATVRSASSSLMDDDDWLASSSGAGAGAGFEGNRYSDIEYRACIELMNPACDDDFSSLCMDARPVTRIGDSEQRQTITTSERYIYK